MGSASSSSYQRIEKGLPREKYNCQDSWNIGHSPNLRRKERRRWWWRAVVKRFLNVVGAELTGQSHLPVEESNEKKHR